MSRFVLTAQLQLQAPSNVGQVVQQIQSQLNGVTVNIQARGTAQAQQQVQQLSRSMTQANGVASNLGRTFAASTKRFAAFAVATKAVSLFTSTLTKATEESIAFERQLVKISQVTGSSITELNDLVGEVTRLSTSLGVSSKSILNASEILAQAGLNAKDTKIALDALAKSELAPTFDNITATAEGAVAILAQFKQGSAALESQLGSLNAVAGKFAVEAGDLIDVIRRTGGVFKASGGNLNELVALFTSVRATTRESAESISTGLRTIFTRIQRPKTIEFLKQFGVELIDLEGKFVGPYEAIKRLSEGLRGLAEGDITFIKIAEELGGFRQIGKVIPLLREFKTAQEALNVAQKGSAGLSQDAATAQLALAIRITKVKEEFLALVRGITDTKSFQIFANTALTLASSLIKLADALKPLIPLLAAVAAVKIAKGLGSFIGGFKGGIGFNQGGVVHKFARGGLVPGSGNSDTVPAMLQPGEFVIRKSSVNKLGAGNLAAMNNNRYAFGGKASRKVGYEKGVGPSPIATVKSNKLGQEVYTLQKNSGLTQYEFDDAKRFADANGYNIQEFKTLITKRAQDKKNKAGLKTNTADLLSILRGSGETKTLSPEAEKLRVMLGGKPRAFASGGIVVDPNKIGAFFLRPEKGADRSPIPIKGQGNIKNSLALSQLGMSPKKNDARQQTFDNLTKEKQASLLGLSSVPVKKLNYDQLFTTSGKLNITPSAQSSGRQVLRNAGISKEQIDNINIDSIGKKLNSRIKKGKATLDAQSVSMSGAISGYYPGLDDLQNSNIAKIISDNTRTGLYNTIIKSVDPVINTLNNPSININKAQAKKGARRIANDPNAQATTQGFAFEGLIQSITGAKLAGNQANFDFPNVRAASSSLKNMFTDASGEGLDSLIKADAKRSNSTDAIDSIKNKIVNDINRGKFDGITFIKKYFGGIIQKFAGGGMVSSKQIDFINSLLSKYGIKDIKALYGESFSQYTMPSANASVLIENLKNNLGIDVATFNRLVESGKARMTPQGIPALTKDMGSSLYSIKDLQAKGISIDDFFRRNPPDAKENPGMYSLDYSKLPAKLTKVSSPSMLWGGGPSAQTYSTGVGRQQKRSTFSTFRRYASGGGVDTDTVPALLTPGEFVINKSSAQSIGYGNLNRMNKVGKYAKGGIVQHFAQGGQSKSNIFSGTGSQLTFITAALQSLIPPINENSGALSKLANNFLSLGTAIGGVIFGLEAFGIQLSAKNLKNIFGSGKGGLGDIINENISKLFNNSTGKLGNFGRALRATTQATARGGNASAVMQTLQQRGVSGLSTNIGGNLGSILGPTARIFGSIISKIAGPLTALSILSSVVGNFRDLDSQLKKAIETQNLSTAQSLAISKSNAEVIPLIGGLVGGFFDLIGASNSLTEFLNIFGGPSIEQIKNGIANQIQSAKASKALAEATDKSAKAIKEFENGTVSATDVIKSTSGANAEAFKLSKIIGKQVVENEAQKGFGVTNPLLRDVTSISTALLRGVGNIGTFGFVQTQAQRNSRIDKENKQLTDQAKQAQAEAFKVSLPGLEILQRQIAVSGGSFEDFIKQLQAADPKLAAYIQSEGAKTLGLTDSFENISKEAERTRKAFNAMNLGLQNVSAASAALGTNLDNYMASQQAGNIKTESTIRTLEASVTNAAQGISSANFASALGDASNSLRQLGASESQVQKFEENLGAINTAQKFFAKSSQETKDKLKAEFERGIVGTTNLTQKRDVFSKVIEKQLAGAGIGPDVRKRISDALEGAKLSETDMQKIIEGDYSSLDDILKDLGNTTLKDVIPALKEKAKYEQELVNLTKKRIDSENQVIAAQRGLLEAQLEAQDIISKYGGKLLTPENRKQNIIAQANAQRGSLGVADLRTGSAAELNQRSAQIRGRLTEIARIRQNAAAGDINAQQQLAGQSGVQLEAEQQRLLELAKSDYETTKKLIQLKEEELKLIGEKNRVEKDSISALISGDAEKFFELQQTKGAQAAIATGNVALQSAFGPAALGAAAQEIQRLQESGVGELYGQQLAGPRGLTERGFGAALGARGINDARMAQVAAGTTMEEELAKSNIRSLAQTLPNSAEIQLMTAQQDIKTADIQFKAAEMQLQAAVKQVEASSGGAQVAGVGASPMFPPTTGLARGGIVYANRGIFVPRGTDTVPAMLTPGEFVVRREAVQRGNNLQLLRAINTGSNSNSSSLASSTGNSTVAMAKGGIVKYYENGNLVNGGVDISKLESVFTAFNNSFTEAINKLANTQLSIKLDATNINVNLTGGAFLDKLKQDTKDELMRELAARFNNLRVGDGGNVRSSTTVL